jgi:hypothetical protein
VGEVDLNGPAPSVGIVVKLTARSTALSVLATVTIPAGATSAQFPITALAAPAQGSVFAVIAGAATGATKGVAITTTP